MSDEDLEMPDFMREDDPYREGDCMREGNYEREIGNRESENDFDELYRDALRRY